MRSAWQARIASPASPVWGVVEGAAVPHRPPPGRGRSSVAVRRCIASTWCPSSPRLRSWHTAIHSPRPSSHASTRAGSPGDHSRAPQLPAARAYLVKQYNVQPAEEQPVHQQPDVPPVLVHIQSIVGADTIGVRLSHPTTPPRCRPATIRQIDPLDMGVAPPARACRPTGTCSDPRMSTSSTVGSVRHRCTICAY